MATTKKPTAICRANYVCDRGHLVRVYCAAQPPAYIHCPECTKPSWRKLFHEDEFYANGITPPAGRYYHDGKNLVKIPDEKKKDV